KLDFAGKFGATISVNAAKEDAVAKIRELTNGGVDFAFDAIGVPQTMEQILRAQAEAKLRDVALTPKDVAPGHTYGFPGEAPLITGTSVAPRAAPRPVALPQQYLDALRSGDKAAAAEILTAITSTGQADYRPRVDPRARYSVQPITRPDGTTGLVRINLETGEVLPLSAEAGALGRLPSDVERGALAYFDRASAADENAAQFEDGLASLGKQLAVQLPNLLTTEAGQRYRQAQREFTEARLRKESGAAIPPSEFANDATTYFAQPGDTATTIAQKQAARQRVRRGLKQQAGNLGASVPDGTAPSVEGATKEIPGYPGTEQTYRAGKWIRTR
ncbi:MAG: zinc-binding dehydrogenase, partial [Elusimicrobiota bacterium]